MTDARSLSHALDGELPPNLDNAAPQFAEWFTGLYASQLNPHRHGMFVRVIRRTGRMNKGVFYELTDGQGNFWEYPREACTRKRAGDLVRLTHGRHCPCSACAAQDWSEPQLAACGMHGRSCPGIYAPIDAPLGTWVEVPR